MKPVKQASKLVGEVFTVRLDQAWYGHLANIADQRGVKISDLVHNALVRSVGQPQRLPPEPRAVSERPAHAARNDLIRRLHAQGVTKPVLEAEFSLSRRRINLILDGAPKPVPEPRPA